MKSEELERFKELIAFWRETHACTGEESYDIAKNATFHFCADALEEVLQSFSKDEETE